MLAWGVAPRPDDQGLASEEGTPSEHAAGGRNRAQLRVPSELNEL